MMICMYINFVTIVIYTIDLILKIGAVDSWEYFSMVFNLNFKPLMTQRLLKEDWK